MITLREWTAGLNLRLDPWKLPANALQVATNVVVKDGGLVPLKGLGAAETTGLGAGTWAWIWKLGSTWLGSTTARYAVTWETSKLVYVTVGASPPQLTNGAATSNLGITGPNAPCSAAAGAGSGITGTNLTYVVTLYDNTLGLESSPSPASGTVSPTNDSVDLTGIPTSGSYYRKIYRTDNSGTYRYVATISDAVTTTYSDTTPVSALGDPLLTENATAAPNLQGLAFATHRAMVGGWINNKFYRSNVGAPWSWSGGSINVPDNVVGAFGSNLGFVVLTAAKPYLLTGTGVDDSRLEPFNNNYGCEASFSICETDRGWVWWSPRGLVLFTPSGQFVELMRESFDAADVDSYSTSGMKAVFADGEVLVFHASGCLRCDMTAMDSRGPVWTTSDQTVDAVHRGSDGVAYVGVGNDVKKWATGSNRTMTVRTAELAPPDAGKALHIRGAEVRHEGSATFQWYSAGSTHGSSQSLSPSNGKTRVWAAMGLWDRAALSISSASTVTEIAVEATEVGGRGS